MSIEHDMKESIEDGVEDGILKAVEKLLQKGLIEEITQTIMNVVGKNLMSVLQNAILIEGILKIITLTELGRNASVILKVIESKFGELVDNELKKEIKRIESFDKIDIILKNILECDSLEEIKTYVKSIAPPQAL